MAEREQEPPPPSAEEIAKLGLHVATSNGVSLDDDEAAEITRKLIADHARLAAEVEARRRCGDRMSNVCFNMKQDGSTLEGNVRAIMARLHKEWDAIPRTVKP